MNLTDLTDDERLALIGLVALVANADDQVSDQEFEELGELGGEMGQEAFRAAYDLSRRRFDGADDVFAFATTISRQGARDLIYTVVVDMAQADGMGSRERDLVRRLATTWSISSRF